MILQLMLFAYSFEKENDEVFSPIEKEKTITALSVEILQKEIFDPQKILLSCKMILVNNKTASAALLFITLLILQSHKFRSYLSLKG